MPEDVREQALETPTIANLIATLTANHKVIVERHSSELAAANTLPADADGTTAKADAVAAASAIKEPKSTKEWPKFLNFDEYFQMEGHVRVVSRG